MPALLITVLIALFADVAPSFGRLLAAALDSLSESLSAPNAPMPVMEHVTQLAQWHVTNMRLSSASYDEQIKLARVALAADLDREKIILDEPTQHMLILIAYNGSKSTLPPDVAVVTTK